MAKKRFVQVPLWWAEAAAKATSGGATALMLIYLLHASWKARSTTFPLPNGYLKQHGVSRKIKYRVLRELEAARLIVVERRHRKSPLVTRRADGINQANAAVQPRPDFPAKVKDWPNSASWLKTADGRSAIGPAIPVATRAAATAHFAS